MRSRHWCVFLFFTLQTRNTLMIRSVPKTATEEEIKAHFTWVDWTVSFHFLHLEQSLYLVWMHCTCMSLSTVATFSSPQCPVLLQRGVPDLRSYRCDPGPWCDHPVESWWGKVRNTKITKNVSCPQWQWEHTNMLKWAGKYYKFW